MKDTQIYMNKLALKVLNLGESETFYDFLFEYIPLEKKENYEGELVYWCSFGISLKQQELITQMLPSENRIGIVEFSIFISEKLILDNLYRKLSSESYNIVSEPKAYDYSPGYYSFKVYDPDENIVEFYTSD